MKVYHNGTEVCVKEVSLRSSFNGNALSRNVLELATSVQQQTIQLEWLAGGTPQTTSFIIEKSMDGRHFKAIQEITNPNDYHFKVVDKNPDYGINHYRIKQQFTSGQIRYSTISTQKYFLDEASISLFPNPAKNVLNLNIGQFTPLEGTIHIFNRFGLEVDSKALTTSNQQLQFNTTAYPNGLYYLIIEAKNRKPITRQFMVENGQ